MLHQFYFCVVYKIFWFHVRLLFRRHIFEGQRRQNIVNFLKESALLLYPGILKKVNKTYLDFQKLLLVKSKRLLNHLHLKHFEIRFDFGLKVKKCVKVNFKYFAFRELSYEIFHSFRIIIEIFLIHFDFGLKIDAC